MPSNYVQTGFKATWNGKEGILTALHGVIGSANTYAAQEINNTYIDKLKIVAVDIDNDVAFLSNGKNIPGTLLITTNYNIKNDVLKYIGYPNGTEIQFSKYLEYDKDHPIVKLGSWHPIVRDMCDTRKSPNCNIDVLLVGESPLLPGLSGAPVFNETTNKVIGIANGGLNGGNDLLNWIIPYSNIHLVPISSCAKACEDLKKKNFAELFALPSSQSKDRFPGGEGCTIKGKIMFGGYGSPPIGSIANYTKAYATIQLMETETRIEIPIDVTYDNTTGEYTISNVPTGKYTPFIRLDAGYPFYKTSGGDFISNLSGLNKDIIVAPYDKDLEINLNVVQSVHLTRPVDNQEERTFAGDPPELLYRQNYSPTASVFEWDPVPGATRYQVTIILMDKTTSKQLDVKTYSITQTTFEPNLTVTPGDTYYMFMVNAYKGDNWSDLIGNFFHYYKNGSGGWFEFKLLERPE